MKIRIGIIGLGYVGLPLAVELGRHFEVIGFDLKTNRIDELNSGFDRTREVHTSELNQKNLVFSNQADSLKDCNFYIVTVPTPVDESNQPDLKPLIGASHTVARFLKRGDIVVYESTVFPGCTEDVCVPILEKQSGLKFNQDFFCGYSPERVAPGDKERTLTKIKKVVSGSNSATLKTIYEVYSKIIVAGVYQAQSIKVAEAAKVIENAQRDINIAFVNELSLIFNRMNIDTKEVLDAAATKWNFLKFSPGLVGGHCIGVDPYYLTAKAVSLGYHPEVILAGRKINDSMGAFVAGQTIKLMIKKGISVSKSKILLLGMTFKENCPDVRNSKVIDIYNELRDFGCEVVVYDPQAIAEEVEEEYSVRLAHESAVSLEKLDSYAAIIIAVGHSQFKELPWKKVDRSQKVLVDVKGMLDRSESDFRL